MLFDSGWRSGIKRERWLCYSLPRFLSFVLQSMCYEPVRPSRRRTALQIPFSVTCVWQMEGLAAR